MNEETFVDLVDRACAEVHPAPPRMESIVRSGRRRRWVGSVATVAGAAATVAVVVVGVAVLSDQRASHAPAAPTGSETPPDSSMTPPSGSRLVGANGVVVAVPVGWGTDQVGCDGRTAIQPTVVFGHHEQGVPTCAVLLDQQVPSLRVDTGRDTHADDPEGEPAEPVAGQTVRRGPSTTDRYGFVTSWIAFPEQDVRFTVTAETTDAVEQVLASARVVAAGYDLVPNWYEQPVGEVQLDYVTDLVRGAGFDPVATEAAHGWQRPGGFLRTVPPIGTPLPAGSTVTVVYAAGNLDYYATPRSLTAGGWAVGPATDFTPAVSRDRAKRIVGATDFNTDAFLRTLAYPVCADGGCPDQRPRLVWLVVDSFHYDGSGNTSHLVVVDAESGERLLAGTFQGTS